MSGPDPASAGEQRPLAEVLVVDFSTRGPGPCCSALLVQLGARVIKFEPPGGDPARAMPRFFTAVNAAKESVVVDLREQIDRDLVSAAVERADVLLHSWRPGVAERFGLDADNLLERKPSLVHCLISGFGYRGEDAGRPGQEITYLAAAGVLRALYGDGGSQVPGLPLGDTSAGQQAALRIVAALLRARSSGLGSRIEVSVAGCLADWSRLGATTAGTPLGRDAVNPAHGIFATADGREIALGTLLHEDRFWSQLCGALERPEMEGLGTAERASRAAELRTAVAAELSRRTGAELSALFDRADVPYELVREPGEVEMPGGMPAFAASAPACDADGAALRRELLG